jgi:multimeric flavodoxin WrbA
MTRLRVLGIAGSPRRQGNTELLLDQVLGAAASKGAVTEKVILSRMNVEPCDACYGCLGSGRCMLQDDFQLLYPKLIKAERIVLAAPVFFLGLSAQAKAFIDRCQCFWVRKYVIQDPLPPTDSGEQRQGFLISTAGGAQTGFQCAIRTMKAFLGVLDADYGGDLTFPGVDEKGAILNHPTALEEAVALGRALAVPRSV